MPRRRSEDVGHFHRRSPGHSSGSRKPRPSAGHAAADWPARWIMALLAIGVAARLVRYLLRFPLWGDEAMLASNFLDRGYGDLLHPLDFHQVAPPLFLWVELTAVRLLGFQEWSLRLFPLLCSIAGLFLFHRLARLLLRGAALTFAVGIFAVSYSGLRYAAEVKPYGVDQMVSILVLWLAASWWRQPNNTRWLWGLAVIAPTALGLSYPAVFVAGGASLAVAAVLAGSRSWRGWRVWAVYTLALGGSFIGWYRLAIVPQAGAELNVMAELWSGAFPPRGSLPGLLAWLARVHAGPLLAVPIGGDHWGSIGTASAMPRGHCRAGPPGPLAALGVLPCPLRFEPPRGRAASLSLRRSHAVDHAPCPAGMHPRRNRNDKCPGMAGRISKNSVRQQGIRQLARCGGELRAGDAGGGLHGPRFRPAGQGATGDPQARLCRLVLEQHGTRP